MKPFHGIVLVLLGLAVLLVQNVSSTDELFYCADPDCKDSISLGVTLLQYRKRTDKHLSFPAGKQIQILSKPAEIGGSEWVAYLDGKVGLVPKSMVREMKMFKYDSQYKLPFSALPFWGGPPAINEPAAHNYVDNPDVKQTPIIEIPVKGAKQLAEEAGQPEPVREQAEGPAQNVTEEKPADSIAPVETMNQEELKTEEEPPAVESNKEEEVESEDESDGAEEGIEDAEEEVDAGKEEFDDEDTDDQPDSSNQTEAQNIPDADNRGGVKLEEHTIDDEITGNVEKKADEVVQPPMQEDLAAVNSSGLQEKENEIEQELALDNVNGIDLSDQHVNVEVHSSVSESTNESEAEPRVENLESKDAAPLAQLVEEIMEAPKPEVISNLEDSEALKAAELEPAIDESAENLANEEKNNNAVDSSDRVESLLKHDSYDSEDEQSTEKPESEKDQPKDIQTSVKSDVPESFGSMFDAVGSLFDGKEEKVEQEKEDEDEKKKKVASELETAEPVKQTDEAEDLKEKIEDDRLEDLSTSGPGNNLVVDQIQSMEVDDALSKSSESPIPKETTEAPIVSDKLDEFTVVPAGFTDTEYDGTLLPVEPSLTQSFAPEDTQQQEPIASSSVETSYSTKIPEEEPSEPLLKIHPEATSTPEQSYETETPAEQPKEIQQQEAVPELPVSEESDSATTTETPILDSSFSIQTGPSSYEKQTFPPEATQGQPPAEKTQSVPENSHQVSYKQLPDLVQDAEKPTNEVPKYDSLPTRDSLYSKFKPDVVSKSPTEPENPEIDDNNNVHQTAPSVSEPEVPSPQQNQNDPFHHHHDHDDHHAHIHSHGHSHSHGHNHGHSHSWDSNDQKETSRFILVVKHLSSTLLGFLPEHLQDMVWDCDDALVLTGLIALTLISICVPYLLIQSVYAVKPLKKQVVELNKNLWKVSAAYENQQEEFDAYKQKALAYDDAHDRISQLEIELQVLKDLDVQNKTQIKKLQSSLKASKKAAEGVEGLIDEVIKEKDIAVSERNTFKSSCATLQAALNSKLEELENAEAHASSIAMDLEVVTHEKENLAKRVAAVEAEHEHLKTKLASESETKRVKEAESENLVQELDKKEADLVDLRRILHQYEDNVSSITAELTAKENELIALKETLGDDSPLIDISEAKAKLKSAEEEASGLKSRVESLNLENQTLSGQLESIKKEFTEVKDKKDEAENNLKVLEGWFQKKEDELRAAVAKLEVEQSVKHKDKDDLIKMIRDKESEVQLLISTNEALKTEIEDMKTGHRADLRTVEAKADERWLSLCQAERKLADSRKEAEQLRQRLVTLMKEKENGEDDDDYTNGENGLFDLPLELVPPPVPDFPTYLHMDPDAIPPPLPLGTEPIMRPPPLGRLSPPPPNNYSYMDDEPLSPLSPITRGGNGTDARGDYSGDSSRSPSPLDHRRPGSRESWMNENRQDTHRSSQRGARRGQGQGGGGPTGPKTSSPIPQGLNL